MGSVRVKMGKLVLKSRHRLLCGDSTKAEDVARLMEGERAACVFTDPPYGVSIGAKNRFLNSVQKAGRCLEDITDDNMSPEDLKRSLLPAFVSLRENIMADDCTLFVSAPQGGELCMMMMMMQESGLPPRHVLIWKKNQPTFSLGRLDYDYQHEPILLTWGKRHKRPMAGQHRTSVWEIDRERKCAEHPTMKPVALYANAYANNSDPGDAVADIYSGSGTAFIAAEQLGRKCYGMEISPQYCDVTIARWEKFTGEKAILATKETEPCQVEDYRE
jgi:DNA modification methylase